MKNLPTFEYSMLEAFEDTSLGNLNTIENDGTIYVPAIETAQILGYKNPRDAIRRHCKHETIAVDEWVVTGTKADGSDAMQCVHKKYICESDFYRLIFHSRLPIAEEFTRWICDEVLPHIRKYGFYPARTSCGAPRHTSRRSTMPSPGRSRLRRRQRSAMRSSKQLPPCRQRHPHVVI